MIVPLGTEEPTPRRSFPIVTALLVGLNVLVFFREVQILLTHGQEALNAFIMDFGAIPAAILHGRTILVPFYLTPLTSMFVHGGVGHILFNMLFLFAFGDNVEDRLGRGRFLLFYIFCGLAASAAQIAAQPASPVPSVGASGAIAGVLAAYVLLFPRGLVRAFLFLGPFIAIRRIPATFFILFWFVVQFFSGVASLGAKTAETGGVAYWAHIGGFVTGLAFAWISKKRSALTN